MKNNIITIIAIFLSWTYAKAQSEGCSTPNLDSAFAVSLAYYNNTELLSTTLQQDGYYDLEETSLPAPHISLARSQ